MSARSIPDLYLGAFSKPWHKDVEPKETAAVNWAEKTEVRIQNWTKGLEF